VNQVRREGGRSHWLAFGSAGALLLAAGLSLRLPASGPHGGSSPLSRVASRIVTACITDNMASMNCFKIPR
jgi:hypothetical protein